MTAEVTGESIGGLDPDAALKQIFKDPVWKLSLGIGSILNAVALVLLGSGKFAMPLLPVAFLVWAASQGYVLRVARTAMNDPQAALPPWNQWSELMISGMVWISIICAQIIVFISVLYFALVFGAMRNWLSALTPEFEVWAYCTIAAGALVLFIATFFLPLVMANFAEKEKVMAVFSLGAVLKRLYKRPSQFVILWLLTTGIYGIAFWVPLLTVIGMFFIPMTMFLAGILNAVLLAQVWREAQ